MTSSRLILIAIIGLSLAAPATAQRRPAAKRPAAGAAASGIEAKADEARRAGRTDEAIELYRRGVRAKPNWDVGWWYLATLLYDKDSYAEAAPAFAAAAKLQPKVGTPWVMLGLCEYRLGKYDLATEHLAKGRELGFGQNDELYTVVSYHEGILALYRGEFEVAQKKLDDLCLRGARSENLILALGCSVLRVPMLPDRMDPQMKEYDMIRQAGFAEYLLGSNNVPEAGREYDRLRANYERELNVQYAYGRYQLVAHDEDGALQSFRKEVEYHPDHVLARLQIAYMYINRKQPDQGLPWAREAVKLSPRFPYGHMILGRILFDLGQNDEAIKSLETAAAMLPTEPKIYYTLARAYDKAKRKADAQRARETFARLSKAAETAGAPAAQQQQQDPNAPQRP